MPRVERRTVDLSPYPDLVLVLLGLRVRRVRGIRRVFGLGPGLQSLESDRPDGLLRHDMFLWSLRPPQIGIRQYWRDYESLERFTRSEPHRQWWLQFMRDTGGTGFWHETYFATGGVEAIYDDMTPAVGLATFAPTHPARGRMFSSRDRARQQGPTAPAVISEAKIYGED